MKPRLRFALGLVGVVLLSLVWVVSSGSVLRDRELLPQDRAAPQEGAPRATGAEAPPRDQRMPDLAIAEDREAGETVAEVLLVRDGDSGNGLAEAFVESADTGSVIARATAGGRVAVTPTAIERGVFVGAPGFTKRFLDERILARCARAPGGAHEVDLRRPALLRVEVVDRTNGRPLEGVEIWVGVLDARLAGNDPRVGKPVEALERVPWKRSRELRERVHAASYAGATDADGVVLLSEVPRDVLLFVVARTASLREERRVRLQELDTTLRIEAEMGRRLWGRLVWPDGTPLDGAWIRLFDSRQVEDGRLQAGGRFEFHRVRSDLVRLEVLRPVPYEKVIDVAACGGDAGDIVLPAVGTLRGRLVLDRPIEDEWHLSCWSEGRRVAFGSPRPDGRFEFVVPVGICRLEVRCAWSGRSPPIAALDLRVPDDGVEIDLRDRTTTVSLRVEGLEPGSEVTLHEFDASAAGPRAWGERGAWGSRRRVVSADGTVVRFAVPPGPHAWVIDAGDRGRGWTGLAEVPPKGLLELGPVSVGHATVRSRDGAPPVDLFCRSALGEVVALSSPEGGEGMMARLPAGPWTLLPGLAGAREEASAWFELVPGEERWLDVPDAEFGSLRGVVTARAIPVVGAQVEWPVFEGRLIEEVRRLGRVFTDRDGAFEIDRVAVGRAALWVRGPAGTLATQEVSVRAGERTTVSIDVGDSSDPARILLREGGEPVPAVERVAVASWTERRGVPARRSSDLDAWEVAGLSGRVLVGAYTTATRHLGGGYADACLLGETFLDGTESVVEPYPGRLVLDLSDGLAAPPVAILRSVEGLPAGLLEAGLPVALVRQRTGPHTIEFRYVPPDANLTLWGPGADGRPVTLEVELHGGTPARLAWPPDG